MTSEARRQPSLFRRLAVVYAGVALISLVFGGLVLHQTLKDVVWQEHRRGILAAGSEILQRVAQDGVSEAPWQLMPEVLRRFDSDTGSMRYVVLSPNQQVIAASPGALPALPRLGPDGPPEVFQLGQDGSRLWGVTLRVASPQGPVDVQIAQDMDRGYIVLDDVPQATLGPLLVVLAIGAVLLFLANVALLSLLLRPLRSAAREAGHIGQGGPARLAEQRMPVEVLPLIQAVNGALDRLDETAAWQRGFSEEVAHELRTPLSIMLAELDLLEPGAMTDRLRRDVQELAQLVTDLLEAAEAARERPLGNAVFDLTALVAETAGRLAPLAEREGHRILPPAAMPPVWVRGHRDSITRALRNLIENALSHAPTGTPVVLRLRRGGNGPVALDVADSGPGVPVAERQNIFRRAWRAGDSHRRGLGLGLSIVERIVHAHGGQVRVGDNPGGGACFTVTLPTAAAPAE